MALTASIIVPTRERAGYLDVALASIAPQAAAAGAEVLVVDDGPDPATRDTAAAPRRALRRPRRLARPRTPRATPASPRRAAACSCSSTTTSPSRPGWLAALLAAERDAEPDVGVLTGPIHARFEDHPLRSCGRESPPITTQDHGPADRDVEHAWGANMLVRRSALQRAGTFDEHARDLRRRAGVAAPPAGRRRAHPLRRRGGARPPPRGRRRAPALARARRLPPRPARAAASTSSRRPPRRCARELRVLAGCVGPHRPLPLPRTGSC